MTNPCTTCKHLRPIHQGLVTTWVCTLLFVRCAAWERYKQRRDER
jgi:hypothetical protein